MKKILLSFLALASIGTTAQIFSEDFSNGIPSTFTLLNVDGNTPSGDVSFVNDAWVGATSTDGNGYAVSTSWYSPAAAADDWMITPAITISSADAYLLWKAGAQDQDFPDGYEVRISVGGTTVNDFLSVVYTSTGEGAPFQKRGVSLALFQGQTIHIAFRNNSNDKFLLQVDDIEVRDFTDYNTAGKSIDLQPLLKVNQSVFVGAEFENLGKELTGADINYSINGGTPVTQTLNNVNIGPTGSALLTSSSKWAPSAAGEYMVRVWLSNLNGSQMDVDNTNDTATALITVSDLVPHRAVVIEEKTGTWCQFCPRGLVGMEFMADNYSSSAIPIAVHNADPMAFAEYDDNIGTVAPGGYPGSAVDRVLGPDPNSSALTTAHNDRQEITATAMVDFSSITYTASSNEIKATVKAQFYTKRQNSDLRFALVIAEDGVTGTTAGYAQVNAYANNARGPMGGYEALPNPVPASQMVYDHVARAILPGFFGAQGSVPANVGIGEIVTYEFITTLPAGVDASKTHLVGMLLDNKTFEVLNAKSYSLTNANIGLVDNVLNGVRIYPNPANDVLGVFVEDTQNPVSVEIVNTVGQKIFAQVFAAGESIKVNTSSFDTGMYVLNVKSNNKVITQRVVVSH